MEYIIGVLIAVLGAFFYERSKRKSSESLLENLETGKKLNELDKQITTNQGLSDMESLKRDELKKEMEEKTNEAVTPSDIIDFFNKRK